jgi:hypothetical protein
MSVLAAADFIIGTFYPNDPPKAMPIKYVIGSIGIFIHFTKQRSRHSVGKNEKEKKRQIPNWNGPAVASTRATWKLASHWRVGSLCLFRQ